MTDQTAPAWFPPAAAPSPQGIPLEPPAAAYAPGATTPAVAPGWASAPAPAPMAAPAVPDANLVFQGAPTAAYSPVLQQASPEAPAAPAAPMHADGPVPAGAIPAHLHPAAGNLMIDSAPAGAPGGTPTHEPHDPTISFASTPVVVDAATAQVAVAAEPAAATAPQTEAAAVAGADATGTWWAPGTALVVAMVALAWQLVATYARERLPARLASGQPIDRFDSIVDRLPLADGVGGQAVGFLLVAAAGTLVYLGFLRGVREPGLQFAIGIVAGLALLLPVLLAAL